MNKNSDANINDILNKLRLNVENQKTDDASDEAVSAENKTPDEILDQLKEHLGETKPEQQDRDSDYDISGFEIEEVEAEEEADEEALSEDSVFAPVSDAEGEVLEDATEDVLASVSAPLDDGIGDAVETLFESDEESEESAELDDTDAFEEELLDTEDEEGSDIVYETDSTPLEDDPAEAVRKRVEAFVEKTVSPDEEFNYFEEMDRRAAEKEEEAQNECDSLVNAEENEQPQEAVEESSESISSPIAAEEMQQEISKEPLPEESVELSGDFEEAVEADETETVVEAFTEDAVSDDAEFNGFKHPFFHKSQLKDEELTHQNQFEKNDAERLDDTDINLLLSLNEKAKLEESVGFVRVREAKNNFYNPAEEEPIGHRVFAYRGEEFHSAEQADAIKGAYRKEKKTLFRKFTVTLLILFSMLFVEYIEWSGIHIPFISVVIGNKNICFLLDLILTALCCLTSAKTFVNGLRGFFMMRPNQHTSVSMVSVWVLLYNLVALALSGSITLHTYGFAVVAFWLLSIIGDSIRLSKETLTFDVVSDEKEKFSLEKEELSPTIVRENAVLQKRDLMVEKVSFVGKYFTRTARRSSMFTAYFVELLVAFVISIFVFILSVFVERSILVAINAFTVSLVLCVPAQQMITDIYAQGRLSKLLYRHSSAVIGENVAAEYVGANTVYLDDIEMFGRHGVSVSGLRVYGGFDLCKILYYTNAVFSLIEGPLRYVFENSAQEIEKAKKLQLLNIYANGIEALVDGEHEAFVGNLDFVKGKGFSPKQNADDDRRVENGEISILYLVLDGELCAKFYVKYSITQRFEKFVVEMNENKTKVGIRTMDPSVTEEMLALLRKGKSTSISVTRPTVNDLVALGKRSDSGIITSKGPHMISRILALCSRVKRATRANAWFRVIFMIANALFALLLCAIGVITSVPAWIIVAIQLSWLLPATLNIILKLK